MDFTDGVAFNTDRPVREYTVIGRGIRLDDGYSAVYADAREKNVTVVLPPVAKNSGNFVLVYATLIGSSLAVNVNSRSGELMIGFDGTDAGITEMTTFSITTSDDFISFFCDGIAWLEIRHKIT